MYDLTNICWICVSSKKDLSYFYKINGELTYFYKLTATLPEMRYKDLDDQRKICNECCDDIDTIYNFRRKCLRSKQILTDYISERSAEKRSELIEIANNIAGKGRNKIEEVYIKEEVCDFESENDLDNYARTEDEISNESKSMLGHVSGETSECSLAKDSGSQALLVPKMKRSYACEFCLQAFTMPHHLKQHRVLHTGKKPPLIAESKLLADEISNESKIMLGHVSAETSECSLEKDSGSQASLSVEIKRPYACEFCLKAFTMPHHLKQHRILHSGKKPYACKHCGKQFSHVSNMKQHEHVHSKVKPYKCSSCDKSFTLAHHLRQHLITHSGKKNHECSFCQKKFSHYSNMKQHLRTHTGAKPYKCEICDRAFSTQSSLKRHHLTHNDSLHQCQVCLQKFTTEQQLVNHQCAQSQTNSSNDTL